jgi:hypothetical protein
MNRMVVRSRVGADGVLRVNVPVGADKAEHVMQITIEPLATADQEQARYVAWLDSIAGTWQGDFERMPQGEFEHRDPL